MQKLRKDQIEAQHVDKIREQYDILEKYLTAHTFMATNSVSIASGTYTSGCFIHSFDLVHFR